MDRRNLLRRIGLFQWMVAACVAIVAFTIAFLFGLQVSAEMLNAILPGVPVVGGVDPAAVVERMGTAWTLLAISVLVIPPAVGGYLLMGGDSGGQVAERPPPGGGRQF